MELTKNGYEFGGVIVSELTKNYGTPLYVYNSDVIVDNYHSLKKAFKGVDVHLKYACKALTNINVLKILQKEGAGLDTVSIQEAKIGLRAGFEPGDILYTPNCVSFDEIKEAVELGLEINIDELSTLERFGNEYGGSVPCCIRLNPHIMAGGNTHISVGHIDSKFGISIYQVPHIKRIVDNLGIHVNGLHMHTGSDILDIEVFLYAAEILFDTALKFKNLEFLDFGSGFKVPYRAGDIETNLEELGEKLTERFHRFCSTYGSELELAFEPGKFLVSEAGYFLSKVNTVKQTTSTVFAQIDSGFNHLIRPMLYGSHHEIYNLSNPNGNHRFYTVVGYICETDTFGTNRKIAEISEGDLLAFKNAGAYCFTMASNYNSRFRPAEILWHENEAYLIRKEENFDDLIQNQILIDFKTKVEA